MMGPPDPLIPVKMKSPSGQVLKAARAAVDAAVDRGELKTLPEETFLEIYLPIAAKIGQRTLGRDAPLVVALSGTPGTGKSTMAAYLAVLLRDGFGLRTAGFSMDDLYLSHDERKALAAEVHPLFATRGVPGTHRVELGLEVLERLSTAKEGEVTRLPRFSKNTDDPLPESEWPAFEGRPDVIIIDSWFWNTKVAGGNELRRPLNRREAEEDSDGTWRRTVNHALSERYGPLFSKADYWVHLEAPSWEATVRWRVDQEMDLRLELPPEERPKGDPTARLRHFLEVFERIGTRPYQGTPDVVLGLGEDHSMTVK